VVHDPIAEPSEAEHEYSIKLVSWDSLPQAEAIVAAVSHKEYMNKPLLEIAQKLKAGGVFIDIKSAFNPETLRSAGFKVWRL
jgi:UDP-N-acetyl-D-galactosamine dehydrogenase